MVLTGFSPDATGQAIAVSGLDLTIASEAVPLRFTNLPNGYWTSALIKVYQGFSLRAPGFDPQIAIVAESIKQTISLGKYLISSFAAGVNNFTGPIDVVNGENGLLSCHGNCLVSYNKAAAVKDMFYPAASNGSSWYLALDTGQGLNFHYSGTLAYEHSHDFLKTNGF